MRTLLLNIRNRTKLQFSKHFQFYSRKLSSDSLRKEDRDNMEVGKNPRSQKRNQVGAIAITFIHRLLTIVGRFISKFVYGEKGRAMPPITDLTLTESASSLAAKIRTQKVGRSGWVIAIAFIALCFTSQISCIYYNCIHALSKYERVCSQSVEYHHEITYSHFR